MAKLYGWMPRTGFRLKVYAFFNLASSKNILNYFSLSLVFSTELCIFVKVNYVKHLDKKTMKNSTFLFVVIGGALVIAGICTKVLIEVWTFNPNIF